jgi:hypothetical protein
VTASSGIESGADNWSSLPHLQAGIIIRSDEDIRYSTQHYLAQHEAVLPAVVQRTRLLLVRVVTALMSPVKGQPAHSLAVDCLVFGLSGLSNRSDRVPRKYYPQTKHKRREPSPPRLGSFYLLEASGA